MVLHEFVWSAGRYSLIVDLLFTSQSREFIHSKVQVLLRSYFGSLGPTKTIVHFLPSSSPLEAPPPKLTLGKQIRQPDGILDETSIETKHRLHSIVSPYIQRLRYGGHEELQAFSTRRSGQRTLVCSEGLSTKCGDERGEVQWTSGCYFAWGRDGWQRWEQRGENACS